jgi:hypothetical protein
MPETDDLTLIVLKGHLLVEEALNDVAGSVLPHPEHLSSARLGFFALACVVRAAVAEKSTNEAWNLIAMLNTLRNNLAHGLESPKRPELIRNVLQIAVQVQPFDDMKFDKSDEHELSDCERLRRSIIDCLEFLLSLIPRAAEPHA